MIQDKRMNATPSRSPKSPTKVTKWRKWRRPDFFHFERHPEARSLPDLADPLAVARDVADRTVVAVLGLLDRGAVGGREDVLALDDGPAHLASLSILYSFIVVPPLPETSRPRS